MDVSVRGDRHDKLDAYLSAWVTSLYPEDVAACGEPPLDVIWLPSARGLAQTSQAAAPVEYQRSVEVFVPKGSLLIMKNPLSAAKQQRGLSSNILKGWGNQCQFCNNPLVMSDVDQKVSDMLDDFQQKYSKILRESVKSALMNRRQLMGVHVVGDSKKSPIYK